MNMCTHIKRKSGSEQAKVVNAEPLMDDWGSVNIILSPVVYSSTLFRLLPNIMGSMRAPSVSKAKISQMV